MTIYDDSRKPERQSHLFCDRESREMPLQDRTGWLSSSFSNSMPFQTALLPGMAAVHLSITITCAGWHTDQKVLTLQELWKLPRVPLLWKCVCVPLQPPNFLEYPRAKRMSRNRRLNSTSKGCFQTFNETIYTSSSHFIQSETFISQVSSSSKWINMFGVFL